MNPVSRALYTPLNYKFPHFSENQKKKHTGFQSILKNKSTDLLPIIQILK